MSKVTINMKMSSALWKYCGEVEFEEAKGLILRELASIERCLNDLDEGAA